MSLADSIYDPPIDELAAAFKDNSEELRIFAGQSSARFCAFFVLELMDRVQSLPADFVSNRPELTPAVVYAEIVDWVLSPDGQEKGGIKGVFRRVDESKFFRSLVRITPSQLTASPRLFRSALEPVGGPSDREDVLALL